MSYRSLLILVALPLAACQPGPASAPANQAIANQQVPVAPAPSPPASPSAKPIALDTLSDADTIRFGTGCSCSFVAGNDTLIHLAERKVMVKIDGKTEICAITDEQESALAGGTGSFECGGYKFAMQGKGEVEQGQNDDSGRDATLTVTQGARTRTYEGAVACAC